MRVDIGRRVVEAEVVSEAVWLAHFEAHHAMVEPAASFVKFYIA